MRPIGMDQRDLVVGGTIHSMCFGTLFRLTGTLWGKRSCGAHFAEESLNLRLECLATFRQLAG
jgi:hypothetical protein